MSRTEIYNMMDNQNINLSLGNNALEILNNGAGFLGNLSNKFYAGKENPDLTSGFESAAWLMEFVDDVDKQVPITEPFTLDDILEGKLITNNTVTEILTDSPCASPLSSSDESIYDLDDILFPASPEDVLASTSPSSTVPSAEHMYAESTPVCLPGTDVDIELKELIKYQAPSPAQSMDSGFNSSGEESIVDTEDLLSQLLSGAYDFKALESDELIQEQATSSTIDKDALTFDFNVARTNVQTPSKVEKPVAVMESKEVRLSPYKKKQKTFEQKLRKKAQNRTAASRYRSKKTVEMDKMFKEAEELEIKNKDLHTKVDGLKTEINYLKTLMLDVIKARLTNGGSLPEELNASSLLAI